MRTPGDAARNACARAPIWAPHSRTFSIARWAALRMSVDS
jgi:hypothetical protein